VSGPVLEASWRKTLCAAWVAVALGCHLAPAWAGCKVAPEAPAESATAGDPVADLALAETLLAQGDRHDAAAALQRVIRHRPRVDDAYYAAWKAIKPLLKDFPEYEPDPTIRAGLIERLLPEDLAARVAAAPVLLVAVTSLDGKCDCCTAGNQRLAAIAPQLQGKLPVAYITYEPYSSMQRDLIEGHRIVGVPTYLLFRDGRLAASEVGAVDGMAAALLQIAKDAAADGGKK
jgi:hypothetical protein